MASRRTFIAGAAVAVFGSTAVRATRPPIVGGWHEALLVVSDIAPWVDTLITLGGWEIAQQTRADRSLNRLWDLPAGAIAEQTLMRNRGEATGAIRLIRVHGVTQRPIRPDDQAWETGAIAALDFRVVDLSATRAALSLRGWRAPSEPVRYEAYPGIEVLQWVPVSPDGVRISFIQRIAPPLSGWPHLRRWSRAINAAIITSDLSTSSHFFGDVLGFPVGGRSKSIGSGGANVMGLPWALQKQISTEIVGYRPGGDDGSVELISMPEARGRDHSAGARPPNRGIAGLRFAVADAQGLAAHFVAKGVTIAAPLQPLAIPHEKLVAFAVEGPDGIWLEFVEIGR